MRRVNFLDINGQFLRMGKDTGYLFLAADAPTGQVIHFDIVPEADAPHWTRFLLSFSASTGDRPLGIVHPGNRALEDAIGVVFKGVECQLCTRDFLSALYQYLRNFQTHPLVSNVREMIFYRAVNHLLQASTFKRALKLYKSLRSNPDFAIPELENPVRWLEERWPLLTARYRVPGLPSEAWVADRAIAEIILLIRSFEAGLDKYSVLDLIQKNISGIDEALGVEVASRARSRELPALALPASI